MLINLVSCPISSFSFPGKTSSLPELGISNGNRHNIGQSAYVNQLTLSAIQGGNLCLCATRLVHTEHAASLSPEELSFIKDMGAVISEALQTDQEKLQELVAQVGVANAQCVRLGVCVCMCICRFLVIVCCYSVCVCMCIMHVPCYKNGCFEWLVAIGYSWINQRTSGKSVALAH
jgi:hypothetical protein